MNGTLKFTEIGKTGILESENYLFTKTELELIFAEHTALGSDINQKIANHELISVELPENRNIKFHFWVVNDTEDKWMLNITIPKNVEPLLPKKIKELLDNKQPVKNV